MQPITNLRPLGGMETATGQRVKPGLLYRSGQLFQLDSAQQSYLSQTLNIRRIVDMRTAEERQRFPDVTWPGVKYDVTDILAQPSTDNSASLQSMVTEHGNVHDRMIELYEQLALTSSAQQGYHDFITSLLGPDQPMVFHCFAGKDRTGVGAALIFKILGVAPAAIMTDYLRTNQDRQAANQQILAMVRPQVEPQQLATIEQALLVDADYLTHYFDVIDQHFGSFDAYLETGLRLTPAVLDRVRARYLEAK